MHPPLVVGDVVEFDVLSITSDPDIPPEFRTATTTLAAVTDNAYFFFEDSPPAEEVGTATLVFEEEIWPVVAGEFGSPPAPGVDGDDRIAVVHADLGTAIGGYVTQGDGYPRSVVGRSNEREGVYMNTRAAAPGSDDYVYILSHELQHLSQAAADPDEAAWVNEGLSEVAAGLVTGAQPSFAAFLEEPDTQLNAWEEVGGSSRHYQASNLFLRYLLEQTGGDAGELAALEENSVAGVERFLVETGSDRDFAAMVADWTAANYADLPSGPYGYANLEVSGPTLVKAAAAGEGAVHQFAADYIELEADAFSPSASFEFTGDSRVPYLAAQTDAAGPFWWSGRADSIDSTLTREVDLTGVTEATLTFRTWYDIERWFDYGYVAVSTDGGATWEALAGEHTTTEDPLDVAYGPGYSGKSDGWVDERIDLTPYAGSRIQLRFEYVTDTALNKSGWAVDDIAIAEIGLFDDAAGDAGGWHREGFRRLDEGLPQTFQLRLITNTSPPSVEPVDVVDGAASIPLDGLGTEYQSAVVVIVATTDGTTEPASYGYEVVGPSG